MIKASELDSFINFNNKKTILSEKLNDYQKSYIQPFVDRRDPKVIHVYDCLFGEGNNRLYLTDKPIQFEMNEGHEKVKQAIKQLNQLVEFMNKIADADTDEYSFLDKNIKKKHYEPITLENLKTGKMGYSLKQVRGTKKEDVDISILIDNAKAVYNYLADTYKNFQDSGDRNSITKEQLWDWMVELRELNLNGIDKNLKRTLSNFYSISGKKLRADDLIVVISRDPEDLAGASTGSGRDWHSCMRFPEYKGDRNGIYDYHKRLLNAIEFGSIIAYLTSVEDKDIDHPRYRIIINPYFDNPDDLVNSNRIFPITDKMYGDGTLDLQLSMEEVEERRRNREVAYNNDHYGRVDADYDRLPNFVLRNFKRTVREWIEDANEVLTENVPEFTVYKRAKNTTHDFLYYEDNSNGKIIKGLEKIKDTIEVKENLKKYYSGEIEVMPYNVGEVIKLSEERYGIIIGKSIDRIANYVSGINTVANTQKQTAALTILVNKFMDEKVLRLQSNRSENDNSSGFYQSEIRSKLVKQKFNICGDFHNVSVPVWKICSGGDTSDVYEGAVFKCRTFLLSVAEIFGNGKGVANDLEGKQYEYFKIRGTAAVLNSWTRSLYNPKNHNSKKISPATFDYIDSKGDVKFVLADDSNKTEHKVLPCFCI